MTLEFDPRADIGRRAWAAACPVCKAGANCPDCQAGQNCSKHWNFLLGGKPGRPGILELQCPRCGFKWSHDTQYGAASNGSRRFYELERLPNSLDDGWAA